MANDHGKAIRSALLTAHALYKDIPHVVGGGAPMHSGGIPEGYADGGAVDPSMPEPQKTVKAYKLFRHKDGKLYPLYVNANKEVPIGKWLAAEAGPQGKTEGRVKSKLGDLAYRPGWHSGDMPVATHIGSKSQPGLKAPDTRPPEHVWAEVEHPADVDWQSVAHQRAQIMKSGLPNLATAHITDQVPHGGFYRYKTNPNMTGNWLISGGMKVNRVLPHEEVQAINQQHGVYDLPRREPQPQGFDVGGAVSSYQDAPAPKLADMPWRPLADVHADLGGMSEIPSHVQHFGRFMDETSNRAATSGLTPRDLIKAYAITRSSIGRGAVKADNVRREGFEIPHVRGLIRPEGAMGEWLQTPMGQEYLHHAERGRVHTPSVEHAMAVMRPFGKANSVEGHALPWAAQHLPGAEGHVSKMIAAARHAKANPDEWRQFIKGVPGVATSKAGFIGSMLGRGDQPTLDARQIILHTGRPTSEAAKPLSRVGGAEQAVDRLSARQNAMNLSLPEELKPYYQHLAHHAVWDKVANEQTTHEDLMNAMRHAATGGTIKGGQEPYQGLGSHEVARALHASFGQDGGLGGLWKGASDQKVREQLLNTPDYANPNPELVQKALALAQKTHGINQTFDSKSGMSYSNFKGGTKPIQDVTSTVEDIPGVKPKPVNDIDWQDFIAKNKGASLINVGGDRSRLGRLTHINDQKLGWPVDLHAGPDYMREPNEGAVWANAKSNASGFANTVKRLGEKGKVFGVYKPMGPQSVDSSKQLSDALMAQIAGKPLDKKVAKELDAALTSGAHHPVPAERAKAAEAMKGWPGFGNPREARDFLLSKPGTLRSLIIKYLDKADWHKKGVPHIGHTRVALTDPKALTTPGNMLGHRIVELTGGNPKPTAFEHNTYPVPTGGKYVGDVPPVLAHLAMPEVQRGFALKHHKAGMTHPLSEVADARNSFIKMMGEQKNVQPINEEMAQGVGHAQEVQQRLKGMGVPGYEKGGLVDQALRLTRAEGGGLPPTAGPRLSLTPQGLYSQAGAAASALPQAKGSPQQMLASLKGIKPEEVRHSGAAERFGNEKSVSREELAKHFHKVLPKIQETRLSKDDVDIDDDGDQVGHPQYEDYSLPNGQNYRELLMHLPEAKPEPPQHVMDAYKRAEKNASLDAEQWRLKHEFSNPRPNPETDPEHRNIQSRLQNARQQQQELIVKANREAKAKNHYSSHWDTPNVLAHLRMSDRYDPTSPHGDKMLHLEELQSDWGQEGREQGFKGPNFDRVAAETEAHRLADKLTNGRPERGDRERAIELQRQIKAHDTGVPQGPHVGSTNGWADLGLKRALVEAARNGHSRLAWTPDAEQDRRYEGRKKAAEGDAPKGFYDKIVPMRLKEILKKFGHEAEFEPVTITHGPRRAHRGNINPEDLRSTLHSVRLPEELREKILKEGLPAFADGGVVERALRITAHPAKMYAAGGKATKEPDYDVHEDNDFLHVARRNLAQEQGVSGGAGPQARGPGSAAVAGGAGPLGNGAAQPSSDARLARLQAIADSHAKAHGQSPVVDSGNSESSLHKQSAIGRAFQLAATGHPGYEKDVFEAYQRQHPELVQESGAHNYHELKAAAYKQLAKEVKHQFDTLPVAMRFHREGKHGYPSSAHMRKDVLENGKLAVFRGGDKHEFLHNVHPQHGLTENEMFRAIHDVYGHALHGSGFGAKGEERAWNAHRQMFSPLAALAMSAETRGQNSFVNYTPINAQLTADKHAIEAEIAGARRRGDKEGEKKGLERKRETMEGWQYAPQKAVLLPPEMNRPDYEGGMPDYVQKHVEHEPGTGFSSPITHYSPSADVKELDPSRYGTGIPGDERARVMKRPGGVKERAYGYLGTPQSTKPEPGLGSNAFVGQAHGLYDLTSDPIKLGLLAQESNRRSPLGNFNPGVVNQAQAMNDVERMAKEHGYSGVANPKAVYPMAAMFNKTPVQPAPQDDTVNKALQLTAPR